MSPRELTDLYTPTVDEVELAGRASRGETARLGFLVLLKTFQRLGYDCFLEAALARVGKHLFYDTTRNDFSSGRTFISKWRLMTQLLVLPRLFGFQPRPRRQYT